VVGLVWRTYIDSHTLSHSSQRVKQFRFPEWMRNPVFGVKYRAVVKQPMCLEWIRLSHVRDHKYKSIEEFEADFDLAVNNCLEFFKSVRSDRCIRACLPQTLLPCRILRRT
jgi:hypothetical protein